MTAKEMRAYCENGKNCLNCVLPDCLYEGLTQDDYRRQAKNDHAARLASMDNRERKRAEQLRAYRETNKEKLAAQARAYYKANKEKFAARQRAYREANKDRIAAQHAAYYKANKGKIDARQKALRKAFIEANKEELEAQKQYVRALRKSAGLSQTELADRIGASRRNISYWETGQRLVNWEQLQILFPDAKKGGIELKPKNEENRPDDGTSKAVRKIIHK